MSGKCPVGECQNKVQAGRLMCLAHWRLVPTLVQRAVNRTWRAYQRDRDMPALDAYRDARDAAIRAAEKEEKQGSLI